MSFLRSWSSPDRIVPDESPISKSILTRASLRAGSGASHRERDDTGALNSTRAEPACARGRTPVHPAADLDLETLKGQLDRQGYFILKGFFEPKVLDGVRGELARLVDERARLLLAEGKIADALE